MSEKLAIRATDPHASAWVSANAGAGKTTLLTDRVTRLLLSGAEPSRILCLTYTKAAASEMAKRLFGRLGAWSLLPDSELTKNLVAIGAEGPTADSLREARRLFAKALETPGGLKIQTIHSFCQHLLSRFPVEAKIPPRFSVLDERSAAELMQSARNAVLARACTDKMLANSIAVLAVRAADGRFAEILDSAIGDSGKLRALIHRHGGEAGLFAHLRASLNVAEGEDGDEVLAQFCAELGSERSQLERVAAWLASGSASDRKQSGKLAEFVAAGMAAEQFGNLHTLFFTAANEQRVTLVTKATAAREPQLVVFLEALRDRVVAVEERRKAAATATLTEALVRVALTVLDEYGRLKRERAALDYDDLTRATLDLLERGDAALWVLYKLDGGLDHILVDEAQDTSPEQWGIIAKLAEEIFSGKGSGEGRHTRTLFAVGDEKQSIFSFQGAEPTEFGKRRGEFMGRAQDAGLPFADLRPAVSRRSGIAILQFVDAVFESEDARDGLTSTGDPILHEAARETPGRVEVWPPVPVPARPDNDPWEAPVDAPRRDSAAVQLAQSIAARIAGWLKNGDSIPGTEMPVTPGDIMILVRRRNAFTEEMIRQLMEHGVPVAGADRMVLTNQIAIADLVALGRFALLPEDDLTLAALLKSPLVDLLEDDLFALAHAREGSLWQELSARRAETPQWERAHAFLGGVLREADFLPPFEFYARVLGKGVRRRLAARLGAEAEDAIDEFLVLALAHESAHPPSLESFLAWFERGASEVKRDMEQGGGAVRVMTVHGAKGLEAGIVIAPDTAQVPDHERRSGLLYTDDCVYFGMPKAMETPPVSRAKLEAQLREMREYRRLLYVAATRAREWLIVCGYETKNGVHDLSWYKHVETAAKRIGREETIGGEKAIVVGAGLSGSAIRGPSALRESPPLPSFLSAAAPAEEPGLRILRPSENVEEPVLLSPASNSGKRFRRGLLAHALLARLPETPRESWDAVSRAYLARQGLADPDASALAEECLRILRDPEFAALFAEGSRAEAAIVAELPELGHVRVSGQIDRLAVTDTRVLVADFKTNRPPPATPAETPRVYRAQLALYRAALAKIYPGKRIECALVWTDGATLMRLPDSLLDAEIANIMKAQGLRESRP
jgi:ATP-dependent helicase/nuclease subunit A